MRLAFVVCQRKTIFRRRSHWEIEALPSSQVTVLYRLSGDDASPYGMILLAAILPCIYKLGISGDAMRRCFVWSPLL